MSLASIKNFLETRERIFIIPTSYGFYYLSIIFILFLISLSYGHSLAFSATFIFVSVILVSSFYTNYNLAGIEVVSLYQRYNLATKQFDTFVKIKNNSSRMRFDLQVKILNQYSLESLTIDKKSTSSLKIDFNLAAGVHKTNRVRVDTSFPFTLYKSWKNFKVDQKIFILPELKENKKFIDMFSSSDDYDVNNTRKGGVEDFYGHSEYILGDSWKDVDWKAYSRKLGLYKKEFYENVKKESIINIDLVGENREEKLAVFHFLAYHSHLEKSNLTVVINGKSYTWNLSSEIELDQSLKDVFLKLYNE